MKSNSQIELSVIIPVYNAEIYLQECILSLKNQTFKNWECILIDDGSTDSSYDICYNLIRNDARFKIIKIENSGVSVARDIGLAASIGKYISFMDNDDVILPTMYETLMKLIREKTADIACCNYNNAKEIDISKCIISKKIYYLDGKQAVSELLVDGSKKVIFPLWGKIYKKELFFKYNFRKNKELFPWIYCEDVFLTPILFWNASKVVTIEAQLYIHREHSDSLSRSPKLSLFLLDQCQSEYCLLKFYCNKNNANDLYKWQCCHYAKTLMRNWYFLQDAKLEWRKKYNPIITTRFNSCFGDFKKNCKGIEKLNILIFRWNRKLWKLTIGNLYFKFITKIKNRITKNVR